MWIMARSASRVGCWGNPTPPTAGRHGDSPMHVAHFIQRYPPALGGSEAYFARLADHLTHRGDRVTVWTSTAVELGEMWGTQANRERQRAGGFGEPRASASGWFLAN